MKCPGRSSLFTFPISEPSAHLCYDKNPSDDGLQREWSSSPALKCEAPVMTATSRSMCGEVMMDRIESLVFGFGVFELLFQRMQLFGHFGLEQS